MGPFSGSMFVLRGPWRIIPVSKWLVTIVNIQVVQIWLFPIQMAIHGVYEIYIHPRKLTCPLKRGDFNRKYLFQPLIFRGHVSFPGSI